MAEHKMANKASTAKDKKAKPRQKRIRRKRRNLSKLEIKSLFSEDEALAFLTNKLAVANAEQKSEASLQTKAARQLMYLQVCWLNTLLHWKSINTHERCGEMLYFDAQT